MQKQHSSGIDKSIRIWNREKKISETELVYGDSGVRFLYDTFLGKKLVDSVLSRPFFSRIAGAYQSSPKSKGAIPSFIKQYQITMDEYEDTPYLSFNDFFIRKFKEGRRPFASGKNEFPAPCEGRYLAYEKVTAEEVFPVKGDYLSPIQILGRMDYTRDFLNGPCVIIRLCPTDYHRFHFPDDGRYLSHSRLEGKLHSVNPLALKYRSEIFAINERQVSILETENFGKVAFVEVGALCVGKIVQSHATTGPFKKGEEKGYFLFGGSTVILFGEKGAWLPDADLIEKTKQRTESFVKLGAKIGTTVRG